MAAPHFTPLLLLLLFLTLLALTSYSTASKPSTPTSFIKSSCSVTRYPNLCVESLSTYANTIRKSRKQMAQTALSVSLAKARSAKAYVIQMSKSKGMKKKEYEVVKDCVDEMGDSVDRLSKSVGELGHTRVGSGGDDFMWHMSNVQTWVSAALTDDTTCVDGFAGHGLDGELKTAIKNRITSVAQHTSNALALVNHFAEKH